MPSGSSSGNRNLQSMGLEVCATGPGECHALAEFLAAVFHAPVDAAFLNPQLLDWKYFQPRPDWQTPRSWVLKDRSRIVAHAAIWPFRFCLPQGVIDSMHVIDWAASPDVPGAGVLLYRDVIRRTRTLLGLGGSDAARKVVRRLGLSEIGSLELHVRVIRPWRQFRTRRNELLWKNSAKLMRNFLQSRNAASSGGEWTAEPVDSFPDSLEPLLTSAETPGSTRAERSVPLLNYMLGCPFHSRAFLLRARGELRGYLLSTRQGGQTRIADLWITPGTADEWTAAYAAAVQASATDPETCELVAVSYCLFTRAALHSNGFRHCDRKPVWLYDPQSLFPTPPPLQIQALESDLFYMYDPSYPFFT
jgi:hypothetical protein